MGSIDRWLFAPIPARRLAAVRILVGAFAFVYLVVRAPYFLALARQPPARFAPVGVIRWLPEAAWPSAVTIAVYLLTVGLAFAFAAGRGQRWTGPLFAAALTFLLTYRSSFGMVFHTENLMVLHVWILAFAPCGDRWCLGRPDRGPDERSAWPLRLMVLVCLATYFVAGWAKMKNAGWAWVSGEVLAGHIAFDSLRKLQVGSSYSPVGTALLAWPWVFGPLAWASMLLELGAPLAVLSDRIGRWWAVAAWFFHLGVLLLMFIAFPYPLTGVGFAAFFHPERWFERWRRP
jgi:hypothetical protein